MPSVEHWISCLPALLHACAEANDETSAELVLSAMLSAGSRQHQSFLTHFNKNVAQFLGECALCIVLSHVYCSVYEY